MDIVVGELNFEPHSFTVLRHTTMWGGCASPIMHGAFHQKAPNLTCIFFMQGNRKRKSKLDILIDHHYFHYFSLRAKKMTVLR